MVDVKGSRRERAEATRLKIVHAAEAEFLERGFHGATVAAIARRAGVAQQTVYFVFHNKVALISAVIDNAVIGEDEPTIPQESASWKAMEAEPDATEALRIFVRGTGPLFARAAAISEILYAAALTDPEMRDTWDTHETLRVEGFRSVIQGLASKGGLRRGLDIGTATDIFMTIYGDATYHLFITERGWSHGQLIEWYCESLPRLLLEPAPPDRVPDGRSSER